MTGRLDLSLSQDAIDWIREHAAKHNTTFADEAARYAKWQEVLRQAAEARRCPQGHNGELEMFVHARYAFGDTVPITCRPCGIVYQRNSATGAWLRIPEAV